MPNLLEVRNVFIVQQFGESPRLSGIENTIDTNIPNLLEVGNVSPVLSLIQVL